MLTKDGPKVLEFNARFGDPETQVYLPRLENDLLDLLEASVDGALENIQLRWRPQTAVCVVMTAAGYPGTPAKGAPIRRTRRSRRRAQHQNLPCRCRRARRRSGHRRRTGAGRDRLGHRPEPGQNHAYEAVSKIKFDGSQFRTDIGAKALRQTP